MSTSDVMAARAALVAKGVDASEIADAPWGKLTTFNDSEGNGLIMMQGA